MSKNEKKEYGIEILRSSYDNLRLELWYNSKVKLKKYAVIKDGVIIAYTDTEEEGRMYIDGFTAGFCFK